MDYSFDYGDLSGYDGFTSYEGTDDLDLGSQLDNNDFSSFAGGLLGGAIITFILTYIVVIALLSLFMVISTWKMYTKMNKPGWASIIPIYSQWVLFESVGMQGWYSLLSLIPFVGPLVLAVCMIFAYIKLAKCFGKDTGFAVGLVLLTVVFIPILAFGKSKFTEPVIEKTEN